jgi:hypothetical protein
LEDHVIFRAKSFIFCETDLPPLQRMAPIACFQ